jgi:uncharacterized spore protein YtfJ
MASNKVNLGIGKASGMFYTAPAGTALPTDSSSALTSWVEAGAVTEDGITWSTGKDSEPLRNWAKQVERLVAGDEGGTVVAPLMYTEQKTLETIFGAGNVSVAAATSAHGKVTSVTVEAGVSASPMAFLFVMKDGDDLIYLGTERGIVREVGDVSMSPTEAIVWEATIEADSWTLIKDDGQTTS